MAGGFVDELPVVVAPVRGLGQGTAYRDGDAFAGEAEQHGRRGQRGVDPGGEAGGVHVGRGAFQRVVDLQDGLVRFEEEVTRDPHVLEPPLLDAEVHDHELAPGTWYSLCTVLPPVPADASSAAALCGLVHATEPGGAMPGS